jgi:hypothetical protein
VHDSSRAGLAAPCGIFFWGTKKNPCGVLIHGLEITYRSGLTEDPISSFTYSTPLKLSNLFCLQYMLAWMFWLHCTHGYCICHKLLKMKTTIPHSLKSCTNSFSQMSKTTKVLLSWQMKGLLQTWYTSLMRAGCLSLQWIFFHLRQKNKKKHDTHKKFSWNLTPGKDLLPLVFLETWYI